MGAHPARGPTYFGQVEIAIQNRELEGIEAWLVADFLERKISRARFDEICSASLLVFRTTPETSCRRRQADRGFYRGHCFCDRLVLAVRDSGHPHKTHLARPVFFRQQRSGLNGRHLPLYKFARWDQREQFKHGMEAMNE